MDEEALFERTELCLPTPGERVRQRRDDGLAGKQMDTRLVLVSEAGRGYSRWAAVAIGLLGTRSFCGRAYVLRIYGIYGGGTGVGDPRGRTDCKAGRGTWKKAPVAVGASSSESRSGACAQRSDAATNSITHKESFALLRYSSPSNLRCRNDFLPVAVLRIYCV